MTQLRAVFDFSTLVSDLPASRSIQASIEHYGDIISDFMFSSHVKSSDPPPKAIKYADPIQPSTVKSRMTASRSILRHDSEPLEEEDIEEMQAPNEDDEE